VKKCFVYIVLLHLSLLSFAQQNVDKTIGVVGKYIVLRSELEREIKGTVANGGSVTDSLRCAMFDELLYQKLLLAQAEKDSVHVKEEQVDAEMDRRMNYYLGQFGSEEKFEAFYGKTVKQYKEEMRDDIRNILVAQQMQGKVTGEIKVSPQDVRTYYNSIPSDSLPLINTEVEICQLIKRPSVTDEAKKEARAKLEGYRQRVLNGESMSVIATLYTEDPGSAKTGGKYEGIARGTFVPEFEAVAFRLKPNEVSEIFESPFGFHFIQLIARRGELVDVRHILVVAKVSPQDITDAKTALDTIYQKIQDGRLTFCNACAKYSDDKDTKNNCGAIQNKDAGSTRFEIEELGKDEKLVFMLDKMQVGEISKPLIDQTSDKPAFKIIYLKSRTEPHKANLKDDYQRLQNMAQAFKQKTTVDVWINKKMRSIYIHIDDDFRGCSFHRNWKNPNPILK